MRILMMFRPGRRCGRPRSDATLCHKPLSPHITCCGRGAEVVPALGRRRVLWTQAISGEREETSAGCFVFQGDRQARKR